MYLHYYDYCQQLSVFLLPDSGGTAFHYVYCRCMLSDALTSLPCYQS